MKARTHKSPEILKKDATKSENHTWINNKNKQLNTKSVNTSNTI